MDWLLELILSTAIGNWLLLSEWGWLVGYLLIAAFVLFGGSWAVWKYGDVRMGPDPVRPSKLLSDATTVVVQQIGPPPPNYHPNLMPAAAELVEQIDAMADAVTDVIPVYDPLTDYQVTEVIDYSTPLFYEIRRRPKPFELETFTQGIDRARLQRIKEMKP